eukprot:NODE_3350_length_1236_cov_56.004492_g3179_i0.p1 GENE.NODE_3350_length_1236_cov_56.004492_g3179_i0~~NODE_3350_length_1236_cov_56.004492_g3179_i0.p1  ORF type:complete len:324 (+),score=33.34 NODE_3350_length_1236_cov_56.004492_g3179_i0:98-1069(+)
MSDWDNDGGEDVGRTDSLQVSEMAGVPRSVARRAIDTAGGNKQEAYGHLLLGEEVSRGESEMVSEMTGVTRADARRVIDDCGGDADRATLTLLGDSATVKGNTESFDCVICCDEIAPGLGIVLGCGHTFCKQCLQTMAHSDMEEGKTQLTCPSCSANIPPHELRDILGHEESQRLDRRLLENTVVTDPTLHLCSTPDCTYIISWAGEQDGPPQMFCPRCDRVKCLVCGLSPYHTGVSCEQAAKKSSTKEEEKATLDFIRKSNIRICKKCGIPLLKSSGCDKMKCRCGYKFCYSCGTEKATCNCTPSNHGFWDNEVDRGDFTNS